MHYIRVALQSVSILYDCLETLFRRSGISASIC